VVCVLNKKHLFKQTVDVFFFYAQAGHNASSNSLIVIISISHNSSYIRD